jgi:hypothetical protein
MKSTGETDNSEKTLSQCHFVHHKSHMDLTGTETRTSVVRGRRLTAWAMARPNGDFNYVYGMQQVIWHARLTGPKHIAKQC